MTTFPWKTFAAPLAAMCSNLVAGAHVKCENGKQIINQNNGRKFRILVVGSGLTGCLTTLRIRQRLKCSHVINHHQKNQVDLHVVERASYPAGRFGAMAKCQSTIIADIGAQVLSTLNPNDCRARGGHGVSMEDIQLADEIVRDLESDGLLDAVASEQLLGETSERMVWEGLWRHYYAPMGMNSILRSLLDKSNVVPSYGVRVDEIGALGDSIQVYGKARRQSADRSSQTTFSEQYDCVVLCVPSHDALATYVSKFLSKEARHVLENVGYDQRTCEAHFFSAEFRPILAKVMDERYELTVDNDKIEYISWQDPKRGITDMVMSQPCSLVVHGQAGLLEPLAESLDSTLSKLTALSKEKIQSYRIHEKSIRWEVSQMITPMEAVVADPPTNWQCLRGGKNGEIIVAGDFMTQSSYLGCVATADAAARAVVEVIEQDLYRQSQNT
uniref:Amine oxidase domain-containing protein n=1 Tax=Helicotheca tamesis TaxID=374047 RepID=A0A7S2MSK2_9STRA|mmetsp:Transcript_2537/g.3506  ORF Transcript_2537/g.3506 Transcript_2537/m.3506 type:complete len:443 (+) Transcript_2537:304-1632(+)